MQGRDSITTVAEEELDDVTGRLVVNRGVRTRP